MACPLFGTEPLSQPILIYWELYPSKTFRSNFIENSNTFILGNAFEHDVCKMSAILFRPQCVKTGPHAISWIWYAIIPYRSLLIRLQTRGLLLQMFEYVSFITWCKYTSLWQWNCNQSTNPGPILHIEAKTKWPLVSRRHFQIHFLGWKCMNSD